MPEETIDLGDNPTGSPPTSGQVNQIRLALGLAESDEPSFAGLEIGNGTISFDSGGLIFAATGGSITFSDCQIVASPSSSSRASINLGSGSDPSSPASGDLWITSAGLKARISGSTILFADDSAVAKLAIGNTYTGKQTTAASTTAQSGLNLPHGAAPTSPTNGDVWTTTAGAFWRINGSTMQVADNAAVAKLAGGNTISGAQTISGQVELTGQAATNSTSAMTRALADTRYGGAVQQAVKSASTSRTSTTTNADDPHLTLSLAPGNYLVELMVQYHCATGTPGITSELKFSTPAFNYNYQLMRGATGAAGVTVSYPDTGGSASTFHGLDQLDQAGWWRIFGNFDVADAGVLSVQWAQKVSSGDATTVGRGSYLKVHKVS